ncbi:Rep family protein, partial [Anaerosporobacter sp.]|uniref:Rep family protein n=1 Tax=Anaerosporobacter sp. TaxID=1872529 RepID=UPI00286F53A4
MRSAKDVTKKMVESGRKASKTRNWAFVIYPESAPNNWRAMLSETHLPSLISPLHDLDTNEDGEVKKAHYHVVIMSDGPITQVRANEIIEPFNGTKSAERIMSLKGYVRYLAHLDELDKIQYNP